MTWIYSYFAFHNTDDDDVVKAMPYAQNPSGVKLMISDENKAHIKFLPGNLLGVLIN